MDQLTLARVTVARQFLNAGIDYVCPFEKKSDNT
jgi:uroporphyrinogen-III decarboxylase